MDFDRTFRHGRTRNGARIGNGGQDMISENGKLLHIRRRAEGVPASRGIQGMDVFSAGAAKRPGHKRVQRPLWSVCKQSRLAAYLATE